MGGEVPERPKGADCKSAGGTPSEVQILPSPPFLTNKRCEQMRNKISLKCSVCGTKNYYTDKNKNAKEKLSLRKYCPKCDKHTVHNEAK